MRSNFRWRPIKHVAAYAPWKILADTLQFRRLKLIFNRYLYLLRFFISSYIFPTSFSIVWSFARHVNNLQRCSVMDTFPHPHHLTC